MCSRQPGIIRTITPLLLVLFSLFTRSLTALAQLPPGSPPPAAPPGQAAARLVVVLSTQEPGMLATATLIKGLREGLTGTSEQPIEVVVEHLDKYAPALADDKSLGQMFGQKYQGRTPHAMVALGTAAIDVATRIRNRIWAKVPIVFADGAHILDRARTLRNTTGVVEALEIDRTLNSALQLFPGTRRIVAVNGASVIERAAQIEFERTVKNLERGLEVLSLAGQSYEQVAAALASLPPDTLICFLSFRSDSTDRAFNSVAVLQALSPVASRPIFGSEPTYLGAGILGGWQIDYGQLGREVSALALQVLDGEQASALPVERSASIRPMFDWRQLQRWSIADDRLPAGSIVLFMQTSLWKQYRNWILTALGAFGLQATLIGTLLWERGRRRFAEARALALSGQVIQATENERSRIARELHDDISQRLALLSIEIDQFSGSAKARGAGLGADVTAFSSKTRAIADDIHQLAKELHPTTLKMLGLSNAVRAFCAELQARHQLPISVQEETPLHDIPEATAITLYRVVQEALQNVVRHSGASEASVVFGQDVDQISVGITDNGHGFDPGTARGGIGLDGMRERLRLVGGRLRIESKPNAGPHAGTRIEARIPTLPQPLEASP